MSPDDVTYTLLLIISLPLSYFTLFIRDKLYKRLFIVTVGITFAIITCGSSSLHSLIVVLFNFIIISIFTPRYCHIFSFIWCFGYLTFFRLCHLVGFPKTDSFTNVIQLLLTLKMTGIAFEIHDRKYERMFMDTPMSLSSKTTLRTTGSTVSLPVDQRHHPSFLDYFVYSYSFIGMLTGPYYKFETFQDMIESNYNHLVPVWSSVLRRTLPLPFTIFIFVYLSEMFKLEHVTSDWFYKDTTFWQRFSYMVILFTIFRMRLYSAWLVSEAVCMFSCLGAYPAFSMPICGQGPMSRELYDEWKVKPDEAKGQTDFNFTTIKCIDIWDCEFAPTIKEGIKSWNSTVQFWLANNVFKRTRSLRNSYIRVAATMMVSAYWHGIHPGYYLSFIIIPFCLLPEKLILQAFNRTKWSDIRFYVRFSKLLNWVIKMRMFEYMSMGFLLLTLEDTLAYWESINYCVHILIVILIFIGMTACKITARLTSGRMASTKEH